MSLNKNFKKGKKLGADLKKAAEYSRCQQKAVTLFEKHVQDNLGRWF